MASRSSRAEASSARTLIWVPLSRAVLKDPCGLLAEQARHRVLVEVGRAGVEPGVELALEDPLPFLETAQLARHPTQERVDLLRVEPLACCRKRGVGDGLR